MTMDEVRFQTVEERLTALEARLRHAEKQIDTHGSPLWKRILFRIDGWPAWWIVGPRRPRFWHRWFRSS
jgi:hypothetical protein